MSENELLTIWTEHAIGYIKRDPCDKGKAKNWSSYSDAYFDEDTDCILPFWKLKSMIDKKDTIINFYAKIPKMILKIEEKIINENYGDLLLDISKIKKILGMKKEE